MTNRPDKQFELDTKQIAELVNLADFQQGDVFYDLGSGEGKVVIEVAKLSKIKKSVGIENEPEPYETARKASIREHDAKWLRKTVFWYAEMDTKLRDGCNYFYDLDDANVVYYSLHEDMDTLEWVDERFENRRLKIITKDLPLVGYKSVANRANDDCWFFLMRNPLTPIKSKKKWIESVLGARGLTMAHVYSYFGGQLSKRKAYNRKEIIDTLLELERLVNERF